MCKLILKIITIILFLITSYILFISFFIYPCTAQGMSMFPTISPNEIKLTNRWKILTKQEIKREDIVVFEEPSILYISQDKFNPENLLAQYDDNFNINIFRKRWMKRVIGLPNDHIQITENNELYRNGEMIGYATKNGYEDYMYIDLIVPDNSLYVMGDNRRESLDSRSFGCIPIEKVYSILF